MVSDFLRLDPKGGKSVEINLKLSKILDYEQILCKPSDAMIFNLLRKEVKVSDFPIF